MIAPWRSLDWLMFSCARERERLAAFDAMDKINPTFTGCTGDTRAQGLVGASDAPDREDASLHGEVGRGHTITSEPSVLPAYVRNLIERLG